MNLMKKGVVLLLFIMAIVFAYAQEQVLMPVLYGQAFVGNENADGAIVAVYPQGNPADNLTDIVGVDGNANLSSYWKINLNNLQTELNNNDIIVIYATDGQNEATVLHSVDMGQGTNLVNLYLEPKKETQDATIQIFDGWTSFGLPLKPVGIGNTEILGQSIMNFGNASCDVIMLFEGQTQLWEDDILGLEDPSFTLSQGEGYFINCNKNFNYTYQGTLWE